MNKDFIEKSLKARLELFKMYIILVIGLITGISSIILQHELNNKQSALLTIGVIFFVIVFIITIKSYITIVNLIKKLES
ncbi:MAG: hypothetical protein HY738_20355 [Bacteroidia bacterium]|nr:hypothetical protein [Bacteroidia bacterium]